MPKTPTPAAGEAMPAVNRRTILTGIASISATAGAGKAFAGSHLEEVPEKAGSAHTAAHKPEGPAARLRRLSRELAEALEDWIVSDVPGEQWVVHIAPPAADRQSIMLENVTTYPQDFDITFPAKVRGDRDNG